MMGAPRACCRFNIDAVRWASSVPRARTAPGGRSPARRTSESARRSAPARSVSDLPHTKPSTGFRLSWLYLAVGWGRLIAPKPAPLDARFARRAPLALRDQRCDTRARLRLGHFQNRQPPSPVSAPADPGRPGCRCSSAQTRLILFPAPTGSRPSAVRAPAATPRVSPMGSRPSPVIALKIFPTLITTSPSCYLVFEIRFFEANRSRDRRQHVAA